MEIEDLKNLISRGESEELEFKNRLPNIKPLAIIISAFANANGGIIVTGVRDDGNICGVENINNEQSRIKKSLKTISPTLKVETETINIASKSLLIITIPKGNIPYLVAGRIYHRQGEFIKPITSQILYSRITERAKSSDDLQKEVKHLSRTIETMNQELIIARSWKTKIFDMILGGIIGATISFLVWLVFGI